MSIALIEFYLKLNSKSKVLILTHGTSVLRTQYYDEIQQLKPDFNTSLLTSKHDYENVKNNHDVVVAIPQSLPNVKDINKNDFDYVVVDETHEIFFAI